MTCIMWLAARPPCSWGQPRVSHLRSASRRWNERRNCQRSSSASPRAPAPPQSAGNSRRRNSRISPRKLSSSGVNRNSINTTSGRTAPVYYGRRSLDMRPALLLPLLAVVAVYACAGSAVAPSATPTVAPTSTPTPSPTPTFLEPDEAPPLTLAGVFPPRDLSALRLDPKRIRTLIATPDVIPAPHTDVVIRSNGDDFLYTVRATQDITAAADLTVINLEAPLIEGCPYHDSGFTFCGRPGFTAALQAAGVDIATLENNHIGNYGVDGIYQTEDSLTAAGIDHTDRITPLVRDVRGLKFGFLAFNGVGETIDRAKMTAQIRALRPQVDVLAVTVHWGAEYVSLPQSAPGVSEDDPVEG